MFKQTRFSVTDARRIMNRMRIDDNACVYQIKTRMCEGAEAVLIRIATAKYIKKILPEHAGRYNSTEFYVFFDDRHALGFDRASQLIDILNAEKLNAEKLNETGGKK